jgi:predicted signal transduction protein with EAL and GGDEF domain
MWLGHRSACWDDVGVERDLRLGRKRAASPPLDTIKIDRSFVTHLGTSRTEEAIVCAILAMAHSLGLRAVAYAIAAARGQHQIGSVRSAKFQVWTEVDSVWERVDE